MVKTVQLNRKINETVCTDLIFNKHTTTTTTTTTTMMMVKGSTDNVESTAVEKSIENSKFFKLEARGTLRQSLVSLEHFWLKNRNFQKISLGPEKPEGILETLGGPKVYLGVFRSLKLQAHVDARWCSIFSCFYNIFTKLVFMTPVCPNLKKKNSKRKTG